MKAFGSTTITHAWIPGSFDAQHFQLVSFDHPSTCDSSVASLASNDHLTLIQTQNVVAPYRVLNIDQCTNRQS